MVRPSSAPHIQRQSGSETSHGPTSTGQGRAPRTQSRGAANSRPGVSGTPPIGSRSGREARAARDVPKEAPRGPSREMEPAPPELVQAVKAAQRASDANRERWHKFCDEEGGGIRDPARQSALHLQRFLETCTKKGKVQHNTPRPPPPQSLVQSVLAFQRRNADCLSLWERFCDERGGGIRDPKLHKVAFLEDFLRFAETANQEANPSQEMADLVEDVMRVQRRGAQWRVQWETFCDTHGKGTRDPRLHDAKFIRWFLSTIDNGPKQGPHHAEVDRVRRGPQPPDRPPRSPTPEPAVRKPSEKHRGPGPHKGGRDHSRTRMSYQELIVAVKAVQRERPGGREIWHRFVMIAGEACETRAGTTLDICKNSWTRWSPTRGELLHPGLTRISGAW